MYRGRYRLGDRLPLTVLCLNGSRVPAVPDRSPLVLLFLGTSLITSYRIPVMDRYGQTALFQHCQQLDSRFSTGQLRIVFQYSLSGTHYDQTETAEIVPGGDADGASVGLCLFRTAAADQVLVQTDSGRLVRKRNPRL